MNASVFISHSSGDKIFVNQLVAKLKENGVEGIWYDYLNISPNARNINKTLEQGIIKSEFFAIILSPNILSSQWVSYEIAHALRLDKQIIAIKIHAVDTNTLLSNPHINDLLDGGTTKTIDFSNGFGIGFNSLISVLNPTAGEASKNEDILHRILEAEDPDDAELAMSQASLESSLFLPKLMGLTHELTNDKKIEYRVSRTLTYFGRGSISDLINILTAKQIPSQSNQVDESHKSSSFYFGDEAIDYFRRTILSGGNLRWFGQVGAKACLVALSKADTRIKKSISESLFEELRKCIDFITSQREHCNEFPDEFYDTIRLAIEAVGEVGVFERTDAFFIHEFATSALWGDHSQDAKHKLASYIVKCLSRMASKDSLDYLLSMVRDQEIVELYFERNVAPNPWEECFTTMGASAGDELIRIYPNSHEAFKKFILMNLSRIRVPRAQNFVLNAIQSRYSEIDDSLLTTLLWNIAGTGLPEICDKLIDLYVADRTRLREVSETSVYYLDVSIAEALVFATNKELVMRLWPTLWRKNNDHATWYLTKAFSTHLLTEYVSSVTQLLQNGQLPVLRGGAAIALAQMNLITEKEVMDKMGYAEADTELPHLSIALARIGSDKAIPGLVHGLKFSFLKRDLALHEWYGDSLKSLKSPEANIALKKWYNRI